MSKPRGRRGRRKPVGPPPIPPPPEPGLMLTVDTFADPTYWVKQSRRDAPSAINCDVQVRQYTIMVLLVDEPLSVIHERLTRMWHECDNHHHYQALEREGKRYGLILKNDEFGKDRKR